MPDSNFVKKGAELTLKIESLAFGGRGLARYNDFVVFVKDAIPGQTVNTLVYRKKQGYAEARVLEVLEDSPNAVQAPCMHFGVCGGCKTQNLAYDEQLNQKVHQVEDIFRRMGKYPEFKLDDVVPAENVYHYRNKMEFTFSPNRWLLSDEQEDTSKSVALGLHIPGRFDKILNIKECHIQPEIGNRILNKTQEICEAHTELVPYNPKTHTGFLRHLMLRFGIRTQQLMVNIVTAYEDMDKLSPLVDGLLNDISEITSMVNNVNTRKADSAFGEYEILLYGQPTVKENIGNFTIDISANSFFQTNTIQGEKLYEQIVNTARLSGEEVVYDLYCGIGSISLYLAPHAKKVYGFEIIRSALEDAEKNAEKNGVSNVWFFKANLDTYFKKGQLPKRVPKPNIVIVDPPRAGMHPHLTHYLPKLKADKIVYVSCNPTTQARDSRILTENGYTIRRSILVDMFPHTPHIEVVTLFEK